MQQVLKTTNIVKKYGNKKILNNINMTINKGDIYGFIGKNGAGKTTFMRTILSLTQHDEGNIEYCNNKSIEEVGMKIGSLIEEPGLYKSQTAYENLKRFSILYEADISKINEILKVVGLENTGKRKVKDFSLGMRQRMGIAIALLNEPEFLILDEPINGLDPEGIKEIRDIIIKLNKEKKITFLISSHLLDELGKIATKFGIINNGELLEEINAKDLKKKCQSKLIIEVDNIKKSKEIIEKIIDEKDIEIEDNKIYINNNIDKSSIINKKLVEKDISVSSIYPIYDTLEEYFMKRIGE